MTSTRPPSAPAANPPAHVSHRLAQLREVLVVGLFAFGYFAIRGLMHGQESRAFVNADSLVRFERRLGIFWEPSIQHWTLQHNTLANLANWIYIWGHWPVIAGTLLWLLWFHRSALATYRNAMLLSGAVGLVIFATFPVAPPRFLTELGFVDVVLQRSESYRVLQPPSLANLYAAMPSLHVGWNLLMGIAITRNASRWAVKLFGVLMPLAMYLSVVATANHYLLDGLAGSAIAVAALLVIIHRRGATQRAMLAVLGFLPIFAGMPHWHSKGGVNAHATHHEADRAT